MVDIYELLRRDQDGTSEYVKEFLNSIKVGYEADDYGNIFYLDHKNAPLLSAHMDTVRKDADFCIGAFLAESESDKIFSGGILGGDDKCGVYIILKALEAGKKVNFIFSRDEEIGCVGIKKLLKPNYVELKENTERIKNNCLYCLVLDRRGNADIICNENYYGTKSFEDALKKISDDGGFGYKPERGLCSDANTIRDYISTANLSVGYYSPHSQNEYIIKADLEKAYNYTISIIDNLKDKFPARSYSYSYSGGGGSSKYRYDYYDYDDYDGYYGSYYSEHYYNRNKKDKKDECAYCRFDDNTEKLYELRFPDGTSKKLCYYCLKDLKDEIDKLLLTATT